MATRNKVMAELLKVLNIDNIIICVGEDLIKESKFINYPGFVGVSDISINYIAVALGIAMASKYKVILLCDDAYLLRYINTMAQVGVSECINFYVLVFRTSSYSNDLMHSTLLKVIRSIKGVLFNFGILVHDYTPYFKEASTIKVVSSIFNKSLGPLVANIDIDNLRFYNKNYPSFSWDTFVKYLNNTTSGLDTGMVG